MQNRGLVSALILSVLLNLRIAPPVLSGDKIIALGITEASGGSDVANLKTRAVRDGNHYIVNGGKMFITSGMRADWLTCAVRTGGPGAAGISLLLIDMDSPGIERTRLDKMGWMLMQMGKLAAPQARVAVSTLSAVLVVASTGYGLWQGWWLGLLFTVCAYTLIVIRLAEQNNYSMTNP